VFNFSALKKIRLGLYFQPDILLLIIADEFDFVDKSLRNSLHQIYSDIVL